MSKNIQRAFFILFFVVFCLFLTVVFLSLLSFGLRSEKSGESEKKNSLSAAENSVGWAGGAKQIGSLVVQTEENVSSCYGFFSGRAFFTVKHVFSLENMNENAYEHIHSRSYLLPNIGTYVHIGERTLSPTKIFLSDEYDAAILFFDEAFPLLPLEKTFFSSDSCFSPLFGEKGKPLYPCKNADSKLYLLPFCAEKGMSGYPVFDGSGYVNGIICSYDKTNDLTVCLPGAALYSFGFSLQRSLPDFSAFLL